MKTHRILARGLQVLTVMTLLVMPLATEVLNPDHPEKSIHSRITSCNPEKYGWGCMAIDAKYVLESLDKYFGKDDEFVKALQSNQPPSMWSRRATSSSVSRESATR